MKSDLVLSRGSPANTSSASIWWATRMVADYAMLSSMSVLPALFKLTHAIFDVFLDGMNFIALCLRPRAALAAEILFLRKQLGLYVERKKKPRRATNSTRFTLAHLASLFDWRDVLTVVKPDTLIRWHRKGFRLFWKWKSRANGRPRVPGRYPEIDCRHGQRTIRLGERNESPMSSC